MKKTIILTGLAIILAVLIISCNNSKNDKNHDNMNNNEMMSDKNHDYMNNNSKNDKNHDNMNNNEMMSDNNNMQDNDVKVNKNSITKTFDVKGNCSMCKDRIETAAKSIDGVLDADWSIDKKILTLTYKKDLNPKIVLKKIADVGHDNEMFTANDDVYNKLPGCCLYRN